MYVYARGIDIHLIHDNHPVPREQGYCPFYVYSFLENHWEAVNWHSLFLNLFSGSRDLGGPVAEIASLKTLIYWIKRAQSTICHLLGFHTEGFRRQKLSTVLKLEFHRRLYVQLCGKETKS